MPPDMLQPGSAQDWLRYAASDLELAKTCRTPNVMLESLCYHAQQCAEKAVKAVLVARHVPVPRTHSIGLLLDSLPEQALHLAEVVLGWARQIVEQQQVEESAGGTADDAD